VLQTPPHFASRGRASRGSDAYIFFMRPPRLIKGFVFFRKIPAKAVGGFSRLFAGAVCSLPALLSGVPYSS
jgi:hypothetical protein